MPYSPEQMFDLVADVGSYPAFLPLCESLAVRTRKEREGKTVLVAEMVVGYKAIRETFTTQVFLNPPEKVIETKYLDGPFRYLSNRWTFTPAPNGGCVIGFFIDYEFKSRVLSALMGAMFDRAFRKFAEAFEKRAGTIYAVPAA